MKPNHTPGPWSEYTDQLEDTDSDGLLITAENDTFVVCALYSHMGSHFERFENDNANATLIAAAPESHAANCKFVAAIYSEYSIPATASDDCISDTIGSVLADAFFAARAAVAKARGEQ